MPETSVKESPQLAFGENVLEDPELLPAFERWHGLKEKKNAAAKEADVAKKALEARVQQMELSVGEYRVGPFKVVIKDTESRHIEFDTEPKRQIRFSGKPK